MHRRRSSLKQPERLCVPPLRHLLATVARQLQSPRLARQTLLLSSFHHLDDYCFRLQTEHVFFCILIVLCCIVLKSLVEVRIEDTKSFILSNRGPL